MIDTHCHLDLPAFDADRADVLERARAAGVRAVVVPAIRPRTWAPLIDLALAHAHPRIAVALGVHPQIVPELDDDERTRARDVDALVAAVQRAGACAVGECGLDGRTAEPALQEDVFRAHVRAARVLRLPLVVHVLGAHDRACRILREEQAGAIARGDRPSGVLHSYSGGAALVPVYRDLGFAFSFAGPVTYPNARRPIEAARAVPNDLLLAETDAPDQTPTRWRGQRCEPAFLVDVVRALATAREVSFEAMAALTSDNAARVFGFEAPETSP